MRSLFNLSVRSAVVVLCAFVAMISGGVLIVTTAGISRDVTEHESTTVLRSMGAEVGRQLARSLYGRWRELEGLARLAQEAQSAEELRLRLETVARLNDRYAWIGFTRPDGRVAVAAGSLLEGESVAERPWFLAGLQGPFAGDKRGAILLQRTITPNAAEPLHLIDFAAPVRRADGTILGVMASHVTWDAVRDVVRDALSGSDRDALLTDRAGRVLVGPPELEGQVLALPSVLAGRQGISRTGVETWPDGESYLTAVITPISHRNLPSFGWSVIVRQKAETAAAPGRAITRRLAVSLGIVGLVVFLGSLLLGAAVARPLRRLRDSASALADGRLNGPVPDMRGYREVRAIADSLARLQARIAGTETERGASSPVRQSV